MLNNKFKVKNIFKKSFSFYICYIPIYIKWYFLNLQESLDSENIPDPMEGEQTWPTADELKEAEEIIKKRKRVPVGMSDYQAAWIPDSDAGSISKFFI